MLSDALTFIPISLSPASRIPLGKYSWLKARLHNVFYVGEELSVSLDLSKVTKYLAQGDGVAVLKKNGLVVKATIMGKCSIIHIFALGAYL